ncbi:MAG: flagellar basal body protein [Ignavibacteriales bacterium]|nr:flagellar basal body protein [Ignavibacteriales bacterium]
MVRGIDAAASGMIAMQNLNDIIANNLANVNTPGFKQTIATFKNLHDMEVSKIDAKRGFLNDEKIGSLSAWNRDGFHLLLILSKAL